MTIASDLTAQKMKFSIKGFFSKCDQMSANLLNKSLMENFIFSEVSFAAALLKRDGIS